MAYLDPAVLATRVSNLLGLSISAEAAGNSGAVVVRVVGVDRPEGFEVEVTSGLSFVYSELRVDTLARPLLQAVGASDVVRWAQFFANIASLAGAGMRIDASINGAPASSAPSGVVEQFALHGKSLDWMEDPDRCAAELGASTISLMLTLLPLDRGDEAQAESEYEVEGRAHRVEVNAYERSRSNRALAIIAHGTRCIACGFDFAENYGQFGEGYVEIHHLTPVHLMERPVVVNPLEDLVPLCANCHRMVHRIDPPLPPEALRMMYEAHSPKPSARNPEGEGTIVP